MLCQPGFEKAGVEVGGSNLGVVAQRKVQGDGGVYAFHLELAQCAGGGCLN